ncbi:MAG: ADP-ribosylglycohydrolase family protein [Clostridiales bacterium]|nr:ADP-ribosylglycohydrolase family protein [Clostridiales bacterium]
MYGAFIGDIVGSKYEFNNIKTKEFPLFSKDCDYTDDTIMTVAVARAIMLSRQEQYEKSGEGKGFQEFLVEVMQDFGKRYPDPTGAYGGMFANWLRQRNPKPYGSYGNGSAMRVSPCGLAAVTMEEALALARASACITHNHPEGVKGAEAVSAAIFLAKCGKSKAEIKQYLSEHYYDLDFTLDSIRDSYSFDGSCQGSVPQAIVAFLESENFEDAIRNVISIGGDCDTTGAITGSIAWIYYAGYINWVTDRLDPSMQNIKTRAMEYLPKEFIDIADEFLDMCGKRFGTYGRMGGCTSILNLSETKKYGTDWGKPSA